MRTSGYLALTAVLAVAAADAGCNDFKMKCQTTCVAKSGGVSTGQCWGTPTFRFCKCSDASVVVIPGYTCDHPTCSVPLHSGRRGKKSTPRSESRIARQWAL